MQDTLPTAPARTKIYFISDTHLGAGAMDHPLDYERRVVRFLDSIKADCAELFLMGDIIDYWFEYRYVVPRGFTRFLGKLGELTDSGIRVHWFTGNHDIWVRDYLPAETGVELHRTAEVMERQGRKLYLAHGDGLGDDNRAYRLMAGFFRNRTCQRLYAAIHPRWTVAFAHRWSKHSRLTGSKFPDFLGEDREHLVLFAKDYLQHQDASIDYFIFGHRHIMLDLMLSRTARLLILGDWITHFSFAVMEAGNIYLDTFEEAPADRDASAPDRTGVSIAF
jgi:UDP-2,3-diacylglucosamine hydrolase